MGRNKFIPLAPFSMARPGYSLVWERLSAGWMPALVYYFIYLRGKGTGM